MTIRDRILAVYRGETPDVVPFMLDLQHWFYQRNRMPWDIHEAYTTPQTEVLDYHKKMGIGFFMPNLATFFSVRYGPNVSLEAEENVEDRGRTITWRYTTPIGEISRTRLWEDQTYAWGIADWGVKTEQDLRVLAYAMEQRTFVPEWGHYKAWADYIGDCGVIYVPLGYSGMGNLLNAWMGIERVMYAVQDWPGTVHEVVDRINESNLRGIDMLAQSPAEVIVLGDNFSSDIQPPRFFDEWSKPFYVEAIRRLHAAGKYVAIHVDGRLRGALKMVSDAGADCCDAVTPVPMGDLTPEECREEAGPDLILSGGLSPNLALPGTSTEDFKRAVIRWLDLKKHSARLIMAVGDELTVGASQDRVELMRDLVEEYGRY